MNLKHYTVGVGLYIKSRFEASKSSVRRRIRKAQEDDLDKRLIAVGTLAIFAAQAISSVMFLFQVIRKPFSHRRNKQRF